MENTQNFNFKTPLDENKMAISITKKIVNDLQATLQISSLKIEYFVNRISTDPNLSQAFNEVNSLPFYCYISQKMCLFLKALKSQTSEFLGSLYKDICEEQSSKSVTKELTEIKEMLETKKYDDLEALEKYLEKYYAWSQEQDALIHELDITIIKKNGEIQTSPNRVKNNSLDGISQHFTEDKSFQSPHKLEIQDLEKIESSFMRGFPDETHQSSVYLGDSTINKKKRFDSLYSVETIPFKFKGSLILTSLDYPCCLNSRGENEFLIGFTNGKSSICKLRSKDGKNRFKKMIELPQGKQSAFTLSPQSCSRYFNQQSN